MTYLAYLYCALYSYTFAKNKKKYRFIRFFTLEEFWEINLSSKQLN